MSTLPGGWATAGERPVLLRHEEEVGHGARAAGRGLDLAADLLAFAAAHTGLSAARREVLSARIRERALAWKIVFVDVETIDRLNRVRAPYNEAAAP